MTPSSLLGDAPHIISLLSNPSERAEIAVDRARGAILGLAVGNLLGLPVEGWSAARISQSFPNGLTQIDPLERSRPMDDDLAQAVDLAACPGNILRRLLGDATGGWMRVKP